MPAQQTETIEAVRLAAISISIEIDAMVAALPADADLAWISTEPNSPNLTPARLHILWAFSPCSVMLNGALIAFLRGVTWPHVFTFRGISSVLVGEVALR